MKMEQRSKIRISIFVQNVNTKIQFIYFLLKIDRELILYYHNDRRGTEIVHFFKMIKIKEIGEGGKRRNGIGYYSVS